MQRVKTTKMDLKAAFGGGFTAVFGYASYLLKLNPTDIAIETLIKIGVTIILGFVGGIVGLLAKDVYHNQIKKYLWKK